MAWFYYRLKDGPAQCTDNTQYSMVQYLKKARRSHFLASLFTQPFNFARVSVSLYRRKLTHGTFSRSMTDSHGNTLYVQTLL